MPEVLMVSTALPLPPDSKVTRFGLRVRVGLEPLLGEIDVDRFTVPAKPPMLVNVMVPLDAEPRVTFTQDGVAEVEKSGEGAGVQRDRNVRNAWRERIVQVDTAGETVQTCKRDCEGC